MLLTGGAGFIGSALVRRALGRWPDAHLVDLDALTYAGTLDNLRDLPDPARHTFVHGDICDADLVRDLFRTHDFDTVLHLAAESHVDRSIAGSAAFLRTNVEGTRVLLEAARGAWPDPSGRRFHHVSTDEVYGDLAPDAPPSREGDPYRPSSPYSASKAAADHLVHAWARTYGLPVTLSHGTNTYGPRQHPEKLLPVVIGRASRGEPVPIYGDGQQVRDWIFVDDHADAILTVAERGREGVDHHVAGDDPRVNLALAREVCAVLDRQRPGGAPHARHLRFVTDRPGHDRRYALDASRLRGELGWAPRVGLQEGLEATVRYYLGTGQ